ncbi:MAG TPA: alkaline phosphatase family protein [Mycobacteriales bacterium]|nr:alkaline phosphatase family protein [Mycobacteriales bacterium]
MRVVLLVVDGLPHRHVTAARMPQLHALGSADGHALAAGTGVLTSATYPNHATFVTGVGPERHGLTGNWVDRDGRLQAAQDVGPAVPTLFDAAAAAGVAAVAVFGDQNLVGVTGAHAAAAHWPPDGVLPAGVTAGIDGYAADTATLPVLLDALAHDASLVVAQLNDSDSAGHAYGPDDDAAAQVYARSDAAVAAVVDALRPRWGDTVLLVVSDHDQVPAADGDAVDLWSPMHASGLTLTIVPEGDAAVITGTDPTDGAWLDDVDGVVGHRAWCGGRLAWAAPGHCFGYGPVALRGVHGGPATMTQVAVLAGGHPAARTISAAVRQRTPQGVDWAPTIAALLDLDLPTATGQALA